LLFAYSVHYSIGPLPSNVTIYGAMQKDAGSTGRLFLAGLVFYVALAKQFPGNMSSYDDLHGQDHSACSGDLPLSRNSIKGEYKS